MNNEVNQWRYNLAINSITEREILRGFIKFYVLKGYKVNDVIDDLCFRTKNIDLDQMKIAKKSLDIVLQKVSNGEELEEKDIIEVTSEGITEEDLMG